MPDLVVDGHLDLAYNALKGYNLTRPVPERRAAEGRTLEQATVSLPDMTRGGVALAFATLFAQPAGTSLGGPGYATPEEAETQALAQLAVYERWAGEGRVRLVLDRAGLEAHLAAWEGDGVPGLVILMEGADPVREPGDLEGWRRRGVRMLGPAWGRTRYSGGTRAPGGLTPAGRELVREMGDLGMVLDASHMAEESFYDALELEPRRLIASHSNAQALVPTDRQLTDAMIEAIGAANGVVGLVLHNGFLEPHWSREDRGVPVSLGAQLRAHAEHVANLIGWERVGIGSDLDGGLGLEETPLEIDTVADLRMIGEVVPSHARAGVLGENWLRFLRSALP